MEARLSSTSQRRRRHQRRSGIRIPLLLALFLAGVPAWAQISPPTRPSRGRGNVGVGFSLGDPTGASIKLFLDQHQALQFHLAWLPAHHGAGGASVDYLWHPVTLVHSPAVDLVPYFGGGAGFGIWSRHWRTRNDDTRVGLMLRLLAGLALHWQKAPLDTVLEAGWTPYVLETNPTEFHGAHGDVSLKLRYYF